MSSQGPCESPPLPALPVRPPALSVGPRHQSLNSGPQVPLRPSPPILCAYLCSAALRTCTQEQSLSTPCVFGSGPGSGG